MAGVKFCVYSSTPIRMLVVFLIFLHSGACFSCTTLLALFIGGLVNAYWGCYTLHSLKRQTAVDDEGKGSTL